MRRAVLTAVFLISPALLSAQTYDVLIRNGTVIDGTDKPGVPSDVAVRGGAIIAIGPHLTGTAKRGRASPRIRSGSRRRRRGRRWAGTSRR